MKKITTRKFKDGKMKTMKELTGSYRGYEYKLKIVGYSISNRKVDKAEDRIRRLELPLTNMIHQCGYVRLKPVDYYLPKQDDWFYEGEEDVVLLSFYGDIDEITFDREDDFYVGNGRWIGIDFAHYEHFVNPASYIDVIKALRKIIDAIIDARHGINRKENIQCIVL